MRNVSSAVVTLALVMLAGSAAAAQTPTQAGTPATKPLTEQQRRDLRRDRRDRRADRRDVAQDHRDVAHDKQDIRHDARDIAQDRREQRE